MIVRFSTYGQYGKAEYLGRPGYDGLAQVFGGMMNITGDPSKPPQRAKTFTGDFITALTGWASTLMALMEVKKTGRGQVVDLAQYEAVVRIWRGAPSVGEDTTDILASTLGLSGPEIETLYGEKVVHRTEPFTKPQAVAANA